MTEATVFSAQAAARPTLFFKDVLDGLRMSEVWGAFAWDEMQYRYQRSVFGVLWIVISYAFFVGGITLFFGEFAQAGTLQFLSYVALGYASFYFLVSNITDGCQVFATSESWIKSTALPYSIYVYKSIFRSLLPFTLQLATGLGIMAALGWRPPPLAWQALGAVAAFVLCAVALQYFLGLVGARYRDINHLLGTVTRVLFFVTPVLWVREERTGLVAIIADVNPMTHFVEVFRNPLLGTEPRLVSWVVVIAATLALWVAAAAASARMRRRLPFWV